MKYNFIEIINDILNSPKNKLIEKRKKDFFIFFSIIGFLLLNIFGITHYFLDKKILFTFINLICSFILLLNTILYIKFRKIYIFETIVLLIYLASTIVIFIDGGFNNLGFIWAFAFPFFAFFFKGKIGGSIFILLSIAALCIISLLKTLNIINTPYSFVNLLYITSAYIYIAFIAFFYEETMIIGEKTILKQIFNDQLTGLANRSQLIKDIKIPKHYGLILINIDNFKAINDLYKSDIGDLVLIELSKRLLPFKDENNVFNIYKLHADEFAVLTHNTENKDLILELSKKIQRNLTYGLLINNLEIVISVSLGIASGLNNILSNADMALKLAKEKKEDYIYFDNSMQIVEEYEKNFKWLKNLEKAIASDNIIPYYQPIINNKTGKIEKFECLVRLIHEGNEFTPDYFLEISKKSKRYSHITKLMALKVFQRFTNEKFLFSINLSIDDILNDNTISFIKELIKDYNIGNKVIFEIIESKFLENNDKVTDFITSVKDMGSSIAIDDFGCGYSNFEYILRMNIDYIKLDSSLIKTLLTNKHSQIIAKTIVDFSKKLNIKTIAEHVHSKEVYEKVKELDIDYSQGFYFSKPMPDLIENLL